MDPLYSWAPPEEHIDIDEKWNSVIHEITDVHVRSAFPKPDDMTDNEYDDERISFELQFTNDILDLLKSRVTLDNFDWQTAYTRGHAIFTDGFFALKQAAVDPFEVFQGRLDPYVYVDILTWSLRKREHNYINIMPDWAVIELRSDKDDKKNMVAFKKFVNAYRRDVIPFIRAPLWANQFVFHNIDHSVQLRYRTYKDLACDDFPTRKYYSVAVIYEDLTANMSYLLNQHKPENIHDIISVVTGFLRERFPIK